MKNILVIGATGQIGSELTMALRQKYGDSRVIAGGHSKSPSAILRDSGPFVIADCLDSQGITDIIKKYKIDTIYHLAALLSATAEQKPDLAWQVNLQGLINILNISRIYKCAVFFPSSIGVFGSSTPKVNTPQDTVQRPSTMYGITKLTGELLCDYYFKRYELDVRGVRFPGLISYETLPGGGTTDYAVEIFYEAISQKHYTCPLKEKTYLDMMYMPDAIKASIQIMETDSSRLIHRNGYNVTAMSFCPKDLVEEIKNWIPDFTIDYEIDPLKQSIADSWPDSMDDSAARNEWDWSPEYDLAKMTEDMIKQLKEKIKK
ncbi:MAG: NAD-dependent epimerase/dehydratase family protein [Atribacterota bacterium]|jgi:nucleoside-diphosphate-sugar epimerase|nr:NAD-dependent epimerase/dehydratase family protein [Atribacterota bacterium]MDD4765163.1 NAD-dependent epimerase/dehydratase family protein [Atribacterota bacterium]